MKLFLYCNTFVMLRLLDTKDEACTKRSLLSVHFSVWLICKLSKDKQKSFISMPKCKCSSHFCKGIFDIVPYLGQNSQTTLSLRHLWHFQRFSRKWLSLFLSCQWRSMPFRDHCLLSLSRIFFYYFQKTIAKIQTVYF